MPSKGNGTFYGHAGKDGELKYLPSGTALYEFSLAVGKWQGGDKGELTTWWRVSIFGKRAESLHNGQYPVNKGDLVVVTGEPYVRTWQGDDGEHWMACIDASDVVSFGKRGESYAGDDIPGYAYDIPATGPVGDIPF